MKNKKRLMIIGAGPNQLPALQLAKQFGYEVVATDFDEHAVGFELADHKGVVSTKDTDATVAFATELNKKFPIHGVMSMASESAVTVASVAEALGLPGVGIEAAWNATHKITRQKCFKSNDVPSPAFGEARSLEDARQVAAQIGFPVVLKPSDSAGSRGVQLVHNQVELTSAIQEIREISTDQSFLLEEYLIGTEHSIEGIVINGKVYWTAFSDRNYDKKNMFPPFFLEDGDTMPSLLSPEMIKEVERVSIQAVQALGIDFGPVKGDILVNVSGPKVIEMAARLSGDYFCYETTPLHNGTNLLKAVMDQALGLPVDIAGDLTPKYSKGVALRYVWPQPGKVIAIEGIEEVRRLPHVRFFNWEPKWKGLKVGSVVVSPKSMGERIGSVLVSAETRDEAVRLAGEAVKMIKITTVV